MRAGYFVLSTIIRMSLTCGNDRNDESSSAMMKRPTPPSSLALFRRFRSLLFAALGLALYPRDAVSPPRSTQTP